MNPRSKPAAVLITSMALMALAGAQPASAANPVRGTTYVGGLGAAGEISLGVSADGKRVFGPDVEGLPGFCEDTQAPSPVDFNGSNTSSAAISRDGTFKKNFSNDTQLRLSGTFVSGGRLRGRVSSVDRSGCKGESTFTARALPSGAGLRNPIFRAAFETGGTPSDGAPATASQIVPGGVDELTDGSLLIADLNGFDGGARPAVRLIDLDGRVRTLLRAGSSLATPSDVAVLPGGGYLIADAQANCVRRVSSAGAVSVAAGQCTSGNEDGGFAGDGGPATAALLSGPLAVSATSDGGFYVTDGGAAGIYSSNRRVRRVAPDGTISTAAGSGMAGSAGDGGPATLASFNEITDVLPQADGGVLIADAGSFRVRRVTADGTISTVAGTGFSGVAGDGGPATGARLGASGLAPAAGGGFIVSDRDGARLRLVTSEGTIQTLAGAGEVPTGVPAGRAALNRPSAMKVLRNGAIAVVDGGLSLIAGDHESRLLLGLPARYITYKRYVLRRTALPVRVTRRSLLTAVLRTGGRTVMRVRRRVGPGLTTIRLPRKLRPKAPDPRSGASAEYRLLFTAAEGRRVATAHQELFYR